MDIDHIDAINDTDDVNDIASTSSFFHQFQHSCESAKETEPCLPSSSLVPSFFLVSRRSPLASGLPVVFLFCPWCCSESEDSVNNSRIQHSNCLWYLFDFYSLYLSPSQVPMRYNLSSNSLYLHTLPMSKLYQQNRFFFVGSCL